MRKSHCLWMAVALSLSACAGQPPVDDSPGHVEDQELGGLSLNLTGVDTAGKQYRLRQGEFQIWGYPDYPYSTADGGNYSTTVSTETDPDAATIKLHVVPGYYQIYLSSPGWYLERREGGGAWQRVDQAVLLTSNNQSAYVYDGGVTQVNFRFGVDGELIDFRAGDLQIGIEIEKPGEGPGDAGFPGFFGGTGGLGGLLGGGGTGGGLIFVDAGLL